MKLKVLASVFLVAFGLAGISFSDIIKPTNGVKKTTIIKKRHIKKKKVVKVVKKPLKKAVSAPIVPGPSADQTSVSISNYLFAPATTSISPGTIVTWNNLDTVPHTVTVTNGPEQFDSGEITPGGKFSHNFTKIGTFSYDCGIHPSMTGRVTVK